MKLRRCNLQRPSSSHNTSSFVELAIVEFRSPLHKHTIRLLQSAPRPQLPLRRLVVGFRIPPRGSRAFPCILSYPVERPSHLLIAPHLRTRRPRPRPHKPQAPSHRSIGLSEAVASKLLSHPAGRLYEWRDPLRTTTSCWTLMMADATMGIQGEDRQCRMISMGHGHQHPMMNLSVGHQLSIPRTSRRQTQGSAPNIHLTPKPQV